MGRQTAKSHLGRLQHHWSQGKHRLYYRVDQQVRCLPSAWQPEFNLWTHWVKKNQCHQVVSDLHMAPTAHPTPADTKSKIYIHEILHHQDEYGQELPGSSPNQKTNIEDEWECSGVAAVQHKAIVWSTAPPQGVYLKTWRGVSESHTLFMPTLSAPAKSQMHPTCLPWMNGST